MFVEGICPFPFLSSHSPRASFCREADCLRFLAFFLSSSTVERTFEKLSADRAFLKTVLVRLRQILGTMATTLAIRGLF
jgi:hypothetical protein